MLKIKEDKMKDLEKFGFVERELRGWCYTKDCDISTTCFIDKNNREIWFGCNGIINKLNILYDLIKADMVEKVVEDEQD